MAVRSMAVLHSLARALVRRPAGRGGAEHGWTRLVTRTVGSRQPPPVKARSPQLKVSGMSVNLGGNLGDTAKRPRRDWTSRAVPS